MTESEDRHFHFYVFDELNFEIYRSGREDFVAIRSAKNAPSYWFIFTPPKVDDYYFVAATADTPAPRILTVTATLELQEIEKNWWYGIIAVAIGSIILGIPFFPRLF